MKKKSNLDVHIGSYFFSQHGRHKEEMEVVDPDNISVLDIFSNGFGEYAVGFLVCRPGFFAEVQLAWVIVQDRP